MINTSKREAAAKGMISGMEQKLEEHWEGWKQRISELRNAILEHPNVDSSALGVFDRDALEVRPISQATVGLAYRYTFPDRRRAVAFRFDLISSRMNCR